MGADERRGEEEAGPGGAGPERPAGPDGAARRLRDLAERGIAACQGGDRAAVRDLLLELMGALNFDYEEAAGQLLRLYEGGLGEAEADQLDTPLEIFLALRGAL